MTEIKRMFRNRQRIGGPLLRTNANRREQRDCRYGKGLFDDVVLEALHHRDQFALLGGGHGELVQRSAGVVEKFRPIALADVHSMMDGSHVVAEVIDRSASPRTEKINQELQLALEAVDAAIRPKAAKLRVRLQAAEEIRRERRDRIVATETFIQCLLRSAHVCPPISPGR